MEYHDDNGLSQYELHIELINIIKSLYNSTTNSILLNNQIVIPFPIIVGIRQGCLLSPVLFNIFLEIIRQETLEITI